MQLSLGGYLYARRHLLRTPRLAEPLRTVDPQQTDPQRSDQRTTSSPILSRRYSTCGGLFTVVITTGPYYAANTVQAIILLRSVRLVLYIAIFRTVMTQVHFLCFRTMSFLNTLAYYRNGVRAGYL